MIDKPLAMAMLIDSENHMDADNSLIKASAEDLLEVVKANVRFIHLLGAIKVFPSDSIPDDFDGSIVYVSVERYAEMIRHGLIRDDE